MAPPHAANGAAATTSALGCLIASKALHPDRPATLSSPIGGDIVGAIDGADTDGRLTAFESLVEPGQGPPLHTHANEDETLFVVAGSFRFRLEDDVHRVEPGAYVFAPRGTPHAFENIGETAGRLLVHFAPSGMERFFERFAALESPSPEDFARLGAEVGMTIVGPPLAVSHPPAG